MLGKKEINARLLSKFLLEVMVKKYEQNKNGQPNDLLLVQHAGIWETHTNLIRVVPGVSQQGLKRS